VQYLDAVFAKLPGNIHGVSPFSARRTIGLRGSVGYSIGAGASASPSKG
jgi:hypothetical protein